MSIVKDYYTVNEAAEILGVTRQSIYNLRECGDLKELVISNYKRFITGASLWDYVKKIRIKKIHKERLARGPRQKTRRGGLNSPK